MQAKSRLYGRRIKGDIGPTGIDPRTRLPGAILAPAVALTGADQYYDEQSEVQNYTFGSRMVVDERTFHYARGGAAILGPGTFRLSVNADLNTADSWDRLIIAPGVVTGSRTVSFTHANFGEVPTTVALDELVGGWIEIWGAGDLYCWRRIIANTASLAGAPAFITVTVDRPFTFDLAVLATTSCALHRNIYRNTQTGGVYPGYESANGLPPIVVDDGFFFWLQTWGPCFIAPQLGAGGVVIHSRDVYLGANGTVIDLTAALLLGIAPQRIGYVMGASVNAVGNNDIMLQLAP